MKLFIWVYFKGKINLYNKHIKNPSIGNILYYSGGPGSVRGVLQISKWLIEQLVKCLFNIG